MQPLFEEKVDYFQKMIGLGKTSTVKVFKDHIEVVDKAGTNLLNVPFQDITSASHVKGGLVRMRVGEGFHAFQFVTLGYRMLGLIGLMLSGGSKKAVNMAEALRSAGVNVDKKLI